MRTRVVAAGLASGLVNGRDWVPKAGAASGDVDNDGETLPPVPEELIKAILAARPNAE